SGVHIETIRYYERIRLIPKPVRSEGGQRFYSEDNEKRLAFIRRCRALDFSLADIRFLLSIAEKDTPSCAEVEKFTARQLERVEQKLRELRAMVRVLKPLLAECSANRAPSCPVIDRFYEM
ncbi:MAG TPA: MerR family DNA-binding protein, partial [Sphingomonadales bacterium]|nr:MerR family DNA-binding protein [Sphingomonadales bacterium]